MLSTFSIIFFLQVNLFSQQQDNDKIYWNENYKLSWEDFKGNPNRFATSAITACNFWYEYFTKNDTLIIIIKSYFIKSKSWVKSDKQSNHLLQHERIHFNIAELYARQLKKELSQYSFSKLGIKGEIKIKYQSSKNLFLKEQQKYDHETDHSNNKEKQEFWNKKISQELDELKSFSSDTVVVILK